VVVTLDLFEKRPNATIGAQLTPHSSASARLFREANEMSGPDNRKFDLRIEALRRGGQMIFQMAECEKVRISQRRPATRLDRRHPRAAFATFLTQRRLADRRRIAAGQNSAVLGNGELLRL